MKINGYMYTTINSYTYKYTNIIVIIRIKNFIKFYKIVNKINLK